MKTIAPLSPADQSAQLATFVDFFVKEFMAEIWYLEESARGNIPGREEASIGTLFNVACGLASLVPVPGSVIALVASQKLIKASLKLASGIADAVRESEWGSQALAVAEVVKSTWDGYGEQTDDIALVRGEDAESAGLEEGKAVDTESLSVLARWLGHQLAQRYEQALTERLSTEPEAAIMGLARVGARRSLAFLTANGGMSGSPQERTERLLAGVVQGKPMSWYERPLKWFARGERLAGRDDLAKEKFTAEALYVNGVWHRMTEAGCYECCTHSHSKWFNDKICEGQPRYGYIQGQIEVPALTPHEGQAPGYAEWLQRRVAQPVTREMIEYYCASGEMDIAREANITAPQTLNAYLAENYEEFPSHGQAVFHGDLTGLSLSSGNFSGSDLSGSQIEGDLSYCRFDDARLYATQWQGVTSKTHSQVSFARTQLGFANMAGAKFAGDVDVTQADLTCVDLSGASFGAVQQVGAKWYKANLTGVEYEGITKAQREQLAQVAIEQAAQAEKFSALNDKVVALESQIKPLLDKLSASQPVTAGAGAGAGGEIPETERVVSEQQKQLEELLVAQEKRMQFEAYCEEKLVALSLLGDAHSAQLAVVELNLRRVQEAGAQGQVELQKKIDQLGIRVDKVEASVDGLARRSSVIKLRVDDLSSKLSQMQLLLEEQSGLVLSKDLSLEEREAILEKSAIRKVLDVYCTNLSQRQKDLHYYVRPDVIERIPGNQSPGEYMLKVEEGKTEDRSVSLLEEVATYLRGDDCVMLLLGEPGSGKSLFAWYGSQSRLQHYQMVLQDRDPTETPWLPIVIELKNYRLSELSGLLPSYLKSICRLGYEELSAIQNDQKPAHKLLLVLDGFDELKQDADYDKSLLADLYQACGAQDWYAGQVKLIVTCRVRELPDAFLERQYFGHGVKRNYRRRILLPFSQDKIGDYLDERTKAGASQDLELLPAEKYLEVLKTSASVKEMVRNPFVLRLIVEALPGMVKSGMNLKHILRYDIYHGFVKQWFEREVSRLDVAHRKALGVGSKGARNIASSFENYAGILALEMYRQDMLVVSYDEARQDDPAFEVWSKMDEVVAETDIDEEEIKQRLAKRFNSLKATEKRRLMIKEKVNNEAEYIERYLDQELEDSVDQVSAQLEAFKMTSPLRQAGKHYSFIHKSFYEYFMASCLIYTAGSDRLLAERVSTVLSYFAAPEGHETRRLWQEPEVLNFVCDYWAKAEPVVKARLKETWFAVIDATKAHPELGIAGANAGTLLNWVNVNFVGKNWRGVNMPGVDLRRAFIEDTDLRGADLSGAWLHKVQANNTDMRHATLAGVNFGERPKISSGGRCLSVAYHPNNPVVAVAVNQVIRLYHFGEMRWLGQPLKGHTSLINHVCFSPDGAWIASGGEDGTIRRWDAVSGKGFGEPLLGHEGHVRSVSYSNDGRWLASAGEDGTIRQWDATTGEPQGHPMEGHVGQVNSVCYSPDNQWLASGGDDKTIRQWDSKSGQLRGLPLVGHTDKVHSVSFSSDGKWLASGSDDRTVRQWYASSGEMRGAPLLSDGNISSVCYSPDDVWLAAANRDWCILQWHAEDGEQRGAPMYGHTWGINSLCYSPDGNWLVSGSDDHTIRRWFSERGGIQDAPLVGPAGGVTCVAYSNDGKWLATSGWDNTIQQWDAVSGELRGVPFQGHTSTVWDVCYSQDSKWLASGSEDNTIRQWDAETGELRGTPLEGHTKKILRVYYSADDKTLMSVSSDTTLRRWDAASGEQIEEPRKGHPRWISGIDASADGKWLAILGSDEKIYQRNMDTWALRGKPIDAGKRWVTNTCYSPDGKWLANCVGNRINQWDADSGEMRGRPLEGHTKDVTALCYSPDGKVLTSGSIDETVRVWRADTGEQIGQPLRGLNSMVYKLCFSADGLWLVTAGNVVLVWRLVAIASRSSSALSSGEESGYNKEWQFAWGMKCRLMQLSAYGAWLSGVKGLDGRQLDLLRQHGYEGQLNSETGQVEDDKLPPPGEGDLPLSRDEGSLPHQVIGKGLPAIPRAEQEAMSSLRQTMRVSPHGNEEKAAEEADDDVPVLHKDPIAPRGSGVLTTAIGLLKQLELPSRSHRLREALKTIYQDPSSDDHTYLSADMLRSAELALSEKQLCKFARINLTAARESNSLRQVSDAVNLFEDVVGKDHRSVLGKISTLFGHNSQDKFFGSLALGRLRQAELRGSGASAGAGAATS